MSSEDTPDLDLPHVWSVWECSDCGEFMETESEIIMHLGRQKKYDEKPIEIHLTKIEDAEEAIREARQQERQKILDKIKDKRREFNNGRIFEHPQKVLTELLQKIRRSRQHEM